MSAVARTFENVKDVILSAHKNTGAGDKIVFYNDWAENYEQDVAILDYRAPSLAANSISSHFHGDREVAVVLDVACGTGLVATQMKRHGFGHFVGIDGSKSMLELAKKTGLYQDLRHCILGEETLPVQWGLFDVVVIVGALSVGHVPAGVVRELCKAAKPGGYVCMTTRSNHDNADYKATLECELRLMEEEGLWGRVEVTEVEEWMRAVSEQEEGYIPGGYVCMTTRSNHDNVDYKATLECELRLMEEEGLWGRVEVTEVEEWERAVSEQEDGYITGSVYLYKTSPL